MKSVKQQFGAPNPIILAEERAILATVDRALASTSNSQVIGRNGEVPFRNFLERYLPHTFKAASGHFVSPAGHLSPQIDVLVLDSRYPLLASNMDGSVLAMMHGVVAAFEIKTRLTSRDMRTMWHNSTSVSGLANEIPTFADNGFANIRYDAVAYRLARSLSSIDDAYVLAGRSNDTSLDVYVFRLPSNGQPANGELGAQLHFEPIIDENTDATDGFLPICRLSYTPLSDIYYRLVQDGYYTLNARGWSHGDIGQHIMEYMTWATCSWGDYEQLLKRK